MEIRTFRVTYLGAVEEEPMREPLKESTEMALFEASATKPIVQSAQGDSNNMLVLSILGCTISGILGYLCNHI